jgi:hypothetical protein
MNRPIIKVLSLIVIVGLLNACATTPPGSNLDRSVFDTHKIREINIQQLNQSIQPEFVKGSAMGGVIGRVVGASVGVGAVGSIVNGVVDAGVNVLRKKKFEPVLASLGEFNANHTFKETLAQHLKGRAFDANLKLNPDFGHEDTKRTMVPTITPNIMMSENYESVGVLISAYTRQPDKRKPYHTFYFSQQFINDNPAAGNKDQNREFWIENPDALVKKINTGIDDVVQRFANDLNGNEHQLSENTKKPIFKRD